MNKHGNREYESNNNIEQKKKGKNITRESTLFPVCAQLFALSIFNIHFVSFTVVNEQK